CVRKNVSGLSRARIDQQEGKLWVETGLSTNSKLSPFSLNPFFSFSVFRLHFVFVWLKDSFLRLIFGRLKVI
ncbi:MAG: hypothetical protein DRN27_04680, partial [Thermoplasmata archaeon]